MGQIGKYEIIDTLGTGSMGTVYRARDTVLDREIALKTIRAGPAVDPELRERFYREARTCARLQHPNIVTVFDLGESDGMAFIAMELLEGEDLSHLIETKRELPLATRLTLMVQICEALDHAHRHNVIHRDVKPSNIFILPDDRAKVLDFGIARLPSSKLTLVGKVLGTPNYMAPEQILGKGCDGRSDLFAAAVVFFEFITGVHPFHSLFIPRRIASGPPDSLLDIDPQLPISLDEVLTRALEQDPDARYQTGAQFAKKLREVIAELEGTPMPLPRRPTQPGTGPDTHTPPIAEPPPGSDAAEQRISEFLRLLNDFDTAVERRGAEAARRAFEEMEKLQAADDRFSATVGEYAKRLRHLEDSVAALGLPRMSPPPGEPPPQPFTPVATAAANDTPPGGEKADPTGSEEIISAAEPTVMMAVPTEFFKAAPATPAPVSAAPKPTPPPAAPPPATPKPSTPPPPTASKPNVSPASAPTELLDVTQLFDVKPEKPAAQAAPPAQAPAAKPTPPPKTAPPPIQLAGKEDLAKTRVIEVPDRTAPVKAPPTRPAPPPPPPPAARAAGKQPSAKLSPEQKVIAVAAVFLLTLVGAAISYVIVSRQTALESSVGTAEVISAEAGIVAGPASGEKYLLTVRKGDRVNLLRAPASTRPEWAAVQYAPEGKPTPAGYMRTSALGNWSTLAWWEAFRPDDAAGRAERAAYVGRIGAVPGARFGGRCKTCRIGDRQPKPGDGSQDATRRAADGRLAGKSDARPGRNRRRRGSEGRGKRTAATGGCAAAGASAGGDDRTGGSRTGPSASCATGSGSRGTAARQAFRRAGRISAGAGGLGSGPLCQRRAPAASCSEGGSAGSAGSRPDGEGPPGHAGRPGSTAVAMPRITIAGWLLVVCGAMLLGQANRPQGKKAAAPGTKVDTFLYNRAFTLDEVVTAAGAVAPARLKKALENRGVDFPASAENLGKVKAAGASEEILELIAKIAPAGPTAPEPPPPVAPPPPPPPPATGRLIAGCKPAECEIRVNGKPRGVTSGGALAVSDLPPGRYAVDFTKTGYISQQTNVLVESEKTAISAVRLEAELRTLQQFGARLLAKAAAALGGEAGLEQARWLSASGKVTLTDGAGKQSEWVAAIRLMPPDIAYFEMKNGKTAVSLALAGAGLKSSRRFDKVPESAQLETAARAFRLLQPAAVIERIEKEKTKLVANDAQDVQFRAEAGGDVYQVTLGTDGTPARIRYQPPDGPQAAIEAVYSGYAVKDKTHYPARIQIQSPGGLQSRFRFDSVVFDPNPANQKPRL